MQNGFLLHRIVGKYIHFLNCSSGMVQSFEIDDGAEIIKNLKTPDKLITMVPKSTFSFLFDQKKRMKPKDLRASLMELGSEFSFPTTVNIELNQRCSLRCKHCYIPFSKLNNVENELFDKYTTKEITRLFASLKKIGVFLVVLTGGEIFLNKNLKNFLDIAKDQSVVVELFSNLQHIPDWFVENGSNYLISRFQTSVYSTDHNVHDLITGKKGALRNTLKNVRLLKKMGFRVEVATPLMCFNFDSREKTKRYFSRKHITQSFSWPIVNEYYDGHGRKSALNVTKEQFLQFIDENPDFIQKPDFTGKSRICSAGRLLFSISAEGDVFPCSQYPKKMGNIVETSVIDILKGRKMCAIACMTPSQIGNNVPTYNFCMGNNYSETGDPFKVSLSCSDMYKVYEEHIKQKGGEYLK